MEEYQKIYSEFINTYNRNEVLPSQVGEVLVRIAGLFPNYNMTKIASEKAYARICKEEILKSDDMTGKAVSATKATTLSEATQESFDFKTAKGHCENIEMLIGVLKFLQKSLETEYLNPNA